MLKKLGRFFSNFCSLLRIYFVALLTENPINLLTLLHGWENKRKQKQISFQFSAYQLYSEKSETMLEIENLSEIGGSRKNVAENKNPFNLMWQLIILLLKTRANYYRLDLFRLFNLKVYWFFESDFQFKIVLPRLQSSPQAQQSKMG